MALATRPASPTGLQHSSHYAWGLRQGLPCTASCVRRRCCSQTQQDCHVVCRAERRADISVSREGNSAPPGPIEGSTSVEAALEQAQDQTQPLWQVPWDIWSVLLVTASLIIINQAIPLGGQWVLATVQGVPLSSLSLEQRENVGAVAQVGQLAATYMVIQAATKEHQPLPRPWFTYELGLISGLQALSAVVVALGLGVVIAGLAGSGAGTDGASEWRGLVAAEGHPAAPALVLGAVLMAPLTEEYLFRGYLLASLTKWCWPPVAVLISATAFALAHPSSELVPEAVTGMVLGSAFLAARGNLLVPTLAHAGYNAAIVLAAFLFARASS